MPEYKTIDVPTGTYIAWGKLGQEVTLKTLSFDPAGGKDFNGNICALLIGTLVTDCDNYRELRSGAKHERLSAGETVNVDGATTNLRKGLLLAAPKTGDFVRMTYVDTYKTAAGDGKVIKVEHAPAESDAVTEDDI
ncbi:MAG: hypothetical protein ACRD2A_05605 [Vicinamibacterales bacterium]